MIRLLRRINAAQVHTLPGKCHQGVDVEWFLRILECSDQHGRTVIKNVSGRNCAIPPQHTDITIRKEPESLLPERKLIGAGAVGARDQRDCGKTWQ